MKLAAAALFTVVVATPALGWVPITKCAPDAVLVGQTCIDKYEASVWQIPSTNTVLITKVQKGTASLVNLTAGGATQISPASSLSPPYPGTFPADGQWTAPLYAVSIPGVHPTAGQSWFQAQQACGNSRKRLPTNAEWQLAVAGTPEGEAGDNGTTDCNTSTAGDVINTGARTGCVSRWGAFDMVGNLNELVADWVPLSTTCGNWSDWLPGNADSQCFAGAANSGSFLQPGALERGGQWNDGSHAGPLYTFALNPVTSAGVTVGFRCAR